jgi:hypothetical protein
MGQSLLLMTAAASLAAGFLFFTSGRSGGDAVAARANEALAASVATQLAHTGLNEAVQWVVGLSAPRADTVFQGQAQGGRYAVTVTFLPGSTRVRVLSRGWVEGAGRGPNGTRVPVERFVESELDQALAAGGTPALPPFMQYAVATGQLLTANGQVFVEAEDPAMNANVWTSRGAQVNNVNRFDGFLHHVDDFNDAGIRSRTEAAFAPNANPSGYPVLQQSPAIAIPAFVASDHQHLATRTSLGNEVLSGAVALGTATAPTIWYVGGDLQFTASPVTFTGHGIFLVQGNINVSAPVTTAVTETSSVAFYTTNTFNMNSPVTMTGQILAGRDINFHHAGTVLGSILTSGHVNWNGGGRVVYRPANPLLAPMYTTAGAGVARYRVRSVRSSG